MGKIIIEVSTQDTIITNDDRNKLIDFSNNLELIEKSVKKDPERRLTESQLEQLSRGGFILLGIIHKEKPKKKF
jgi:hypothetical protein